MTIEPPPPLPPAKYSGLGWLTLLLCVVPVTLPIGVVLAFIVYARASKGLDLADRALAKIGLWLAGIYLFVALLLVIGARLFDQYLDMPHQPDCASNLRGLANTLLIYAQKNNDQFPAIARGMKADGTPGTKDAIDTQASLWLMVVGGYSSPDVFICPGDGKGGARAFKGTPDPANPFPEVDEDGHPKIGGGFRSWSYSYQIPNGEIGNPSTANANNTKFAIMADRAPFVDDLRPFPSSVTNAPEADRFLLKLTPEQRRAYNSPNHLGDGQYVLFQDGHAKFCTNPCCGINDDNIYTRATGVATTRPGQSSSEADLSSRAIGAKCGPMELPFDDDDSVLVNIQEGVYCKKLGGRD